MENQSEMKLEDSVSSGPVLHCTFCNRPLWDEERGCNVAGMYYVSQSPPGPCVRTCKRCGHVFFALLELVLEKLHGEYSPKTSDRMGFGEGDEK